MTALDSEIPPLALSILGEFGVSAKLLRQVKLYDPAEGVEVTQEEATTCRALPPSTASALAAKGGVSAGSTVTYLAAAELIRSPESGDKITLAGRTWDIASVTTYRSGELAALYQLELVTP